MPHDGAQARADVAATVTRLAHGHFVSDEVGKLLDDLDAAGQDPDSVEGALIRITRREWERASRIPSELAGEMAQVSGVAVAAWDEAKAASDFESFSPHLERQLELKHRYIACFPQTEEPYDVLLDEYEEGFTTAQVEEIFGRLKGELVELVERHRGSAVEEIAGPYPVERQQEAGRLVLEAFGYDPEFWRLDETPHPFAAKPGSRRHPSHDSHRREGSHLAVLDHARVRARGLRVRHRSFVRADAAGPRNLERDPRVAEPDLGEPRRAEPRVLALVLPAAAGTLPRASGQRRRGARSSAP